MAACPLGAAGCFSVVNASGLGFELTLQLVVAQGLANRAHGASVYVVGIELLPGMVGIEWFPGTGCDECHGLRRRWLDTVVAAQPNRRPVALAADTLLKQVRPLLSGGAVYDASMLHSLGPVLTACGVHGLLPAASESSLPRDLKVVFDGRGRWRDATDAAWFVGRHLLSSANASTLALQAPTELPFLADAIVMWRLPMLWMDDMCRNSTQNAALRFVIEGSGHFDASPIVQYLGWFNHTRLPNVELVCQCTQQKRLVTIASDWAENLSFLASVPPPAAPKRYVQPDDAVGVSSYSRERTYVAVVVSDGDNLAQDWSNLRPALERRLALRSRVPVSWTVSNRWLDFGWPVLEWFYGAIARSGGHDSLLMGPSGFGYVFPGAIVDERDRATFARRTIAAAEALDMQAYVHWDVDHSHDRSTAAVRMYNHSAIRGVFMLGSDPIDDVVGDVVVINHPPIPWGFTNASAAAATLNQLPKGSITYVYANMKADPALVDELAAALEPHVMLLGHRTLIRVARMARLERERASAWGAGAASVST